ncbi:MAG: hypothetical protein H0W15_12060 [Gemmatimonadales bacterium]|nr:hypothetical protein [Gemmatimonadales bacterium]
MRPDLSVVIAEAAGVADPAATLQSLVAAQDSIDMEILVTGTAAGRFPSGLGDNVRGVPTAPDALVPVQWAAGIASAAGPVVACLTTDLTVTRTWAAVLHDAVVAGAVGAGSAIALPPDAPAAACGMYLVRFAPFLPRPGRSDDNARAVPGDGAMYDRSAIMEHPDLLENGFWEVEFHRRWLDAGGRLVQSGEPLVDYRGAPPLVAGMAVRFRHGAEYGATMIHAHGHSRLRHVLAAPALPFLLTGRVLRKALRADISPAVVLRGLIPIVGLTIAWSAGELIGALQGGPPSS